MYRYAVFSAALLSGCATLTEPTEQNLVVQTVFDHRDMPGVGCVLYNDVGKWFVTTPARVTVRRSSAPLRVDCRKDDLAWAYEKVDAKAGASSLWGNVVLTAGAGYFVDRNTGAGFDYPATLTVIMHPARNDNLPPPAPGVTVY